MKILVTGAKGFVGKNLCAALKNLKEGKDRTRPALSIDINTADIICIGGSVRNSVAQSQISEFVNLGNKIVTGQKPRLE